MAFVAPGHWPVARLAHVVLLATVLVGCGGRPEGSSVVQSRVAIVTHRDLGGGPAAIVGGALRVDGGCLVFDTVDGLAIPMWPRGTTAWEIDGAVVVADSGGRVAARVGDKAFFGGGTGYPRSSVGEIADAPVPAACDRQATYMLINELKPLVQN